MLDENAEAFIIHIALLTFKILIHLAQKAWITLLVAKKVMVPTKYPDFANVFLKKLASKFS